MAYTDFATITDTSVINEKKAAAIALIFYKGSGLNSDADGGTPDTTTLRTLGVGLKHNPYGLAWCTDSAHAYSKNITTIQCTSSGSVGSYTFTGDKNGSDNLEQIEAFEGVSDTGTEANYPAFYFAKNYKGQKLGSESSSRILTGSEFEDGWYLPSIAELFQIYACRADTTSGFNIDTASQALGGDEFGSSLYWSSSQPASDAILAYLLNFNGAWLDRDKDNNRNVCAIREF